MEKALKASLVISLGLLAALTAPLLAVPAVSAHSHYLYIDGDGDGTPEHCTWLANSDVTGGPHPENNEQLNGDVLHNTVHVGTAGTQGFDQPNNPVDVTKEGTGPGCP